jgi:hypothetical protein
VRGQVQGVAEDLPGWPVVAVMTGYPVWWALGLGLVMPLVLALLMAALLVVRREVVLVPGVLPWLAFCVWLIPCALMLDSALRLVGYAIRTAQFFSVAIVLVYVVNAAARYSLHRAVAGITLLWVGVVVGGYLGMIWPEVRLTTLPGLALPGALAQDEFIRDLFFPPLAEVQEPWGTPQPFNRPAAPFPYANNWGAAIATTTPVALAALNVTRSRALRVGIVAVLLASLVPIGASSNRGMLLALAAALVYAAIRLAVRGRWRPLVGLAVVGAAGAAYYVFGGVGEAIALRQQYSDTTTGRGTLYVETWQRTLESPVLGYGGPRPSYLVEVSLGTQGWIWTLMFSYGFVGLALFVWFLVGAVVRTWRAPSTTTVLMHSSLIAVVVMIPYYGLHVALLVVVAVNAGAMLRECRSWADGDPA